MVDEWQRMPSFVDRDIWASSHHFLTTMNLATGRAAWINKYADYEILSEIAYPFPNFNGWTVDVWKWISHYTQDFIMDIIAYPSWD